MILFYYYGSVRISTSYLDLWAMSTNEVYIRTSDGAARPWLELLN